MKNNDDTIMTCLGWVVGFLVVVVVATLVSGWALSTIWNWFIPPIFKLTSLTLWQAMGVAMVIQLFTGTNKMSKSEDKTKMSATERLVYNALEATIVPLFTVGIAYVVLQFAF